MNERTTVIGVFPGMAAANELKALLHEFGVGEERLTTCVRVTSPAATAETDEPVSTVSADLLDEAEVLRWDDAVRAGAAVVRVDVASSFDADAIEALMRSRGALRTMRD